MTRDKLLLTALGALMILLGISLVNAYDRLTWVMEIFPIVLVVPVLVFTYRRLPLTNFLYRLIFIHAIILMIGGHYTYARVPLGFWIAKAFSLQRNPYDKIGHFAQGLVPAIAAREVLIGGRYIRTPKMLVFVVLSIVLAISAAYELVEWGSAVALGQGADDFLGTQGDPWDTQSDMLFAFMGGAVALVFLSRFHNSQIASLQGNPHGA